MPGTSPPLALASSLAVSICAGALSRPKKCVVALPGIELCRAFGDWVAKSRPRPLLDRDQVLVLAAQAERGLAVRGGQRLLIGLRDEVDAARDEHRRQRGVERG